MSKTWEASITVYLGKLSLEDFKDDEYYNKYLEHYFPDRDNPTDKQINEYFSRIKEHYSGSNDGSEMIANAKIDIKVEDN